MDLLVSWAGLLAGSAAGLHFGVGFAAVFARKSTMGPPAGVFLFRRCASEAWVSTGTFHAANISSNGPLGYR